MARSPSKRPTDAELEILDVLWELGPATVREVHDALSARPGSRGSGYTTVLKHMQIMTDKGLLERDADVRPQQYTAVKTRGHTQRQLLGQLVDRVFSGSAGSLVLAALAARKATADERQAIRELLDEMQDESRDGEAEPRDDALEDDA